MTRRNFIKLSLATLYALEIQTSLYASELDVKNVEFSKEIYEKNNAQLIIVYLYGGASQLAGNLSNLDEIKKYSQSDYDHYFRSITPTQNQCWQEAGGLYMEDMLASNAMSIFRTSYSKEREKVKNKAHGLCTDELQKGTFNLQNAGIVTNIAKVLEHNGVVDKESILPFITFEGESTFYAQDDKALSGYLRAVGLDKDLNNPYSRYDRYWYLYSKEERSQEKYNDKVLGFDPSFSKAMDTMAQKHTQNHKILDALEKRESLSNFIDNISQKETPDLGDDSYISGDDFAKKMESSIKVLAHNPDTKIITLNTGGLGGWDDHNDARDYVVRSEKLFKTLKSGLTHIKALNKQDNISIMVFGEFGRNVNLNSAFGWDHGNLQNFYIFGGQSYLNHQGVVGETLLDNTGSINRLYLKPKDDSFTFEHISIAATIYKIFGITNPEILTNGQKEITPLFVS